MESERWTLKGKRALITGGTKGIGFAVAQEILELGGEVYIVARDAKLIDGRIASWQNQGFSALGFVADVSVNADRTKLFQQISHKWDRIDILINNVGTNITYFQHP